MGEGKGADEEDTDTGTACIFVCCNSSLQREMRLLSVHISDLPTTRLGMISPKLISPAPPRVPLQMQRTEYPPPGAVVTAAAAAASQIAAGMRDSRAK